METVRKKPQKETNIDFLDESTERLERYKKINLDIKKRAEDIKKDIDTYKNSFPTIKNTSIMKQVSEMINLFVDIQNYQGLVDDEIEDLIKKVKESCDSLK